MILIVGAGPCGLGAAKRLVENARTGWELLESQEAAGGEWLYFLGSQDHLYDKYVLKKVFAGPIEKRIGLIYGNVIIRGGDARFAKEGAVYDGEFNIEKLFQENICTSEYLNIKEPILSSKEYRRRWQDLIKKVQKFLVLPTHKY